MSTRDCVVGENEVILNNKDCIITSTSTIAEQQGMKIFISHIFFFAYTINYFFDALLFSSKICL